MVYDLIVLANSKEHAKALQMDYDEANLNIKVKCISKNVIEKRDGVRGKFVVLANNTSLTNKEYGVIRSFAREMEKDRYQNRKTSR